jgi:ribonuclease HI
MELTSVVSALKELKEPCVVTVYSDSSYVVNAVNKEWINNWQKNGWINSKKKTLPNLNLWKELYGLLSEHKVTFIWVKGHSDNEYNNRCDRIAVEERDSI